MLLNNNPVLEPFKYFIENPLSLYIRCGNLLTLITDNGKINSLFVKVVQLVGKFDRPV